MINQQKLYTLVHGSFQKDCRMDDISTICNIYHYAVADGFAARQLVDLSKNAIRILALHSNEFVDTELHKMLLNVPDVYYDFIWGIENNIKNNKEFQWRLRNFLTRHPNADTSDIIEFISILNEDPKATDDEIYLAIELFRHADISPDEHYEIVKKESIPSYLNKGWTVSKQIIQGKGFTFRQSRSVCFVDFCDRCIGSGCVRKYDERTANILYLVIHRPDKYPGVLEVLLKYLERIAIKAGAEQAFVWCVDSQERAFYEKNGYQEDSNLRDELGYRVAMIKKF